MASDVTFDFERQRRIGLSEAVFCEGKSPAQIGEIIALSRARATPLLLTRLVPDTLAAIGGYLHDIGNAISRWGHGQTGAVLVHQLLSDRLEPPELGVVMAAVGNHEEDEGMGAGPVAAAVILADKSDVHRSRVRKTAQIDFDIHDRVNYAAEQSFLRVDSAARTITLELRIDTSISHVMEYFEIFLGRMMMCRRAAERLECSFHLDINGASLL